MVQGVKEQKPYDVVIVGAGAAGIEWVLLYNTLVSRIIYC